MGVAHLSDDLCVLLAERIFVDDTVGTRAQELSFGSPGGRAALLQSRWQLRLLKRSIILMQRRACICQTDAQLANAASAEEELERELVDTEKCGDVANGQHCMCSCF